MVNVVVVGAGFAGLSAAVRLAKLRHQVTLIEQKDVLGGELRGIERDGVTWQSHRETVTLPGVFRDLFRKSGRQLERSIEFEQIAGRRHVFKDKLVLDLPMGNRGDQHDAVMAAFDNDQWSPWVDTFAPVWDSLRRVALDRTFDGRKDFTKTQWKSLRARRSLAAVAKRDLDEYYLRKLVLDPARLDGDERILTPGFVAVSHYVERNFGLWRFPGGRPALADALTKRLEERKVDVVTGATALDITFSEGHANGVTTSNGDIRADMVIWCAPSPPASLPAPTGLRRMPLSRTFLALNESELDLSDEILVHSNPPIRLWRSAPGQWTVEHSSGEDPIMAIARLGLDLRAAITARWTQSPVDLVQQCHWGWQWQTWTSALTVPGVAPRNGVHFAGAHAHAGGSLELIGMATAAIAESIGPEAR